MAPRTSRWLVLPFFLGLAGLAAAKPASPGATPKPKAAKLDPAWTKQIVPIAAKALVKPPLERKPDFASVRKMTPADKATALDTQPDEVQGPLRFSARKTFIDDRNYFDVEHGAGNLLLRSSRGYIFLKPAAGAVGRQPTIELHFAAAANRRYLLECMVDAASGVPQTITAKDGSATEYSVTMAEHKATLFYRLEAAGSARDITVQIQGKTDVPWYFDGCELSWTDA